MRFITIRQRRYLTLTSLSSSWTNTSSLLTKEGSFLVLRQHQKQQPHDWFKLSLDGNYNRRYVTWTTSRRTSIMESINPNSANCNGTNGGRLNGSNGITGQSNATPRGRSNPYATTSMNTSNELNQQQQVRSVSTNVKKVTKVKPKKTPKVATSTKRMKSPVTPKKTTSKKTLKNGEKGAEVHTVEEEYRIRLTRSLMELRENDNVQILQFPSTLTNTERKFVHELSRKFGLTSKSKGKGDDRSITVTKPAVKPKTATLNEESLPVLSMGPWGKDALHKFVERFPPSHDELLESHETGTSLLEAIGRGETDESILTRLSDLGLTDTYMMDGNPSRARFDRPVDSNRRMEYHNQAQRIKQTNPNFTKIMNQRLKLPAYRHYDKVVQTVAHNPITIISGETGCGKSTQIPQFILDANPACKMVVTQPRRISAISIAERVAEEQCQASVGGLIGYQVRLEHNVTKDTQCIFMTPGILLRMMHSSPMLTEYTHIVIDEIHERDRFQEFLLVVLRDLLPKRPDLRLVLMSATLQSKELVEYFVQGGLQPTVIEMEGRTFPVQEYFLEQVLEMTGFIDPSSKYDVGSKLEAEMAKITGNQIINDKVANVSLQCAMCGQQGFTDPLALGEHIALCDGGLSFFKVRSNDSTKKKVNPIDSAFLHYINDYGDFDLSDVQGDDNQSEKGSLSSNSSDSVDSKSKRKVAVTMAKNELARNKGPKSDDNKAKKSTLHFDELITAAPIAPSVEISRMEKALLAKYQTTQNDEDIDFRLVLELVRYIARLSYGDGGILIFFPGWYEISQFSQLLESTAPFSDKSRYLVLPLHSGIASRDQRRVMQPPPKGTRKIVLSTNIAETSLTINDIVYVIDTGRAKEKNYDPHLKTSTLQPTWISQASAKQRKGRAGRVKPGICFHLFSRTRHESMRKFTESELLRTPLVCSIVSCCDIYL
jgi:ATP-dependent RNA helicase DHX36